LPGIEKSLLASFASRDGDLTGEAEFNIDNLVFFPPELIFLLPATFLLLPAMFLLPRLFILLGMEKSLIALAWGCDKV
tara:strand:- start:32 stop:265 length:234 start_codon:yes stop_codon:yes gene_type:complete